MTPFKANNEIWSSRKDTEVSRTPGFSLQICYQLGESHFGDIVSIYRNKGFGISDFQNPCWLCILGLR